MGQVPRIPRIPRWTILALVGVLAGGGLLVWRQGPVQLLRRGEAALAQRRFDQARETLSAYLAQRPNDVHARLLAARAARHEKEYFEAFDHLRRFRELGGDEGVYTVETTLIEVERGREPPEGLRHRAERGDDLSLEILEVLIQYDLDTYRLRGALAGLNLYLDRRPEDLQALLARGFVWERFLYFADAAKDYRRAVAAHPQSVAARLKLARTLLIAGTPQEAEAHFEHLAAGGVETTEVTLGRARCRRLLGKSEEAQRLLTDLLAREPDHGEALWERGQIEMDRGRAAAAEPWLRRAVQADGNDRRFAHGLSRCLSALGKKGEAAEFEARVAAIDADLRRLEEVRQGVMERPRDAALRREGGLLFLRRGEKEEGIRWLRQALRLDPSDPVSRNALEKAVPR